METTAILSLILGVTFGTLGLSGIIKSFKNRTW